MGIYETLRELRDLMANEANDLTAAASRNDAIRKGTDALLRQLQERPSHCEFVPRGAMQRELKMRLSWFEYVEQEGLDWKNTELYGRAFRAFTKGFHLGAKECCKEGK